MKNYFVLVQILLASIAYSTPYTDITLSHSFDGLLADNFEDFGSDFDQTSALDPQPEPILSSFEFTNSTGFNDDDVLMGRGGHNLSHPGNINYRRIIEENKFIYRLLTKQEKMNMSISLLYMFKDQGIRFMEYDKTTLDWHEVADARARMKISQCLRERPNPALNLIPQI